MTDPNKMPEQSGLHRTSRLTLDSMFLPRTIVLIDGLQAAGSVADLTWKNLTKHRKPESVKRLTADASFSQELIGKGVDLAVVVAPDEDCDHIVKQCHLADVHSILVMDAYYREANLDSYHDFNLSHETRHSFHMLGPHSFGIIAPHQNLNLTPLQTMPRKGNIALLSQSGSICTSVLDWSFRTGVGFSAIVSVGLMRDVDWHDLITYFGDDPYTKSIVIFMETIGDARSFLSAAREVALSKPLILLKAGSISDNTAMEDVLLDAALERVGVLRVRTIGELFYMANILATQPLPKGPRLMIVTNAAGPGKMATDSLLAWGGKLADVSPDITAKLSIDFPRSGQLINPINLLGDATAEHFGKSVSTVARDKSTNGILVILTPQQSTEPDASAERIIDVTKNIGKPVLASWMGGDLVAAGQARLIAAGIPAFPYPDTPARLFALMWKQSQNLDGIYETPLVIEDEEAMPTDGNSVTVMLDGIASEGRTDLTEWESKAILRAYGIPVVETLPASTEDEAVTCATILGYPIMVKLHSRNPSLKHTLYGRRMNLRTEQDIREAFRSIRQSVVQAEAMKHFLGVTVQPMISTRGLELSVATKIDDNFGPYITFGTGGHMADFINDYAFGLPPLTTALAQRIIEKTRIYKQIASRGDFQAFPFTALQSLLVRVGQLIVQHPTIKELEINPLLSIDDRLVSLDARMSLFTKSELLNRPRPAIRPYPNQYMWRETIRNGATLLLRAVRPEDEPLVVEFHKTLSEESIYRRYFFQHKLSRRTSHERLRRTCFLDFDREIALAALLESASGDKYITAVGRLARNRSGETAELAMVVSDDYQGLGIGSLLLKHLIDIAKAEGIEKVVGTMLPGNIHMQHLFTRAGFGIHSHDRETVSAQIIINRETN